MFRFMILRIWFLARITKSMVIKNLLFSDISGYFLCFLKEIPNCIPLNFFNQNQFLNITKSRASGRFIDVASSKLSWEFVCFSNTKSATISALDFYESYGYKVCPLMKIPEVYFNFQTVSLINPKLNREKNILSKW